MSQRRRTLRIAVAFALAVCAARFIPAHMPTRAQANSPAKTFRPDLRRARASKARTAQASAAKASVAARANGYTPRRGDLSALGARPSRTGHARTTFDGGTPQQQRRRSPARPAARGKTAGDAANDAQASALINSRIAYGTSPARVLHTSQLSTDSSAGLVEQLADSDGDLEADERTTFDADGGAFDLAVGRSGLRYQVYSALDDRGTANRSDDRSIGVLRSAFDYNGDFIRDNVIYFDLFARYGLPSAASVVAGTSRAGREYVVVSSSGYYNYTDPQDPANEPTAGVVLLVMNAFGDIEFSRTLVAPGSAQLNNANALALLPTGDLLVADFDSNELRVVRDRDRDGAPDTLDPAPYYSYQFSNDAPLDITANSRGVVFSHSSGNDTVMLALYDTNENGFADTEEVVVEGLSIDDNLILHGLTVDREGTVYVIQDALGEIDLPSDGGNGGTPSIDAFPDPALNGFLRDGALYYSLSHLSGEALTALAFGTDTALRPVASLTLTNSASLRGDATRDGLGTILGSHLTGGRRGATASEAVGRGLRVTVEGTNAPVHSFADDEIHIYVPATVAAGTRSVVVSLDGHTVAAEDVTIANANPGLFTLNGTGAGDAVALLASGMRYTASPFPARFAGEPSVVVLFGTGFRRATPVAATVGGRAATVEYAGASRDFPGLDQINLRLPDNTNGNAPVILRTADGATSRSDVVIRVN